MPIDNNKSKYLIIGLGKTGISCIEYLLPHYDLVVFDTRSSVAELSSYQTRWPGVSFYAGTAPDNVLDNVKEVVVSPGVELTIPILEAARQLGLPIIGDVELFARVAKAPIIGITGTNAKSTVTTLVSDMINAAGKRARMGGNIGVPALDLLKEHVPDYYILELSSFQLETTHTLKSLVGSVLNISPDHLDRHMSMEAYQASKEILYRNCLNPVINRAMHYACQFATPPLSFGLDEPSEGQFGLRSYQDQPYLARGNELLMPIIEMSPGLSGQHNVENVLSALAIVSPLGLPMAPMLEVIKKFKGLPHRCRLVAEVDHVKWFNDSKGTNVGATLAAIEGLGPQCSGKIILLAGGVGKGQDFSPLAPAVQKYVSKTILFGEDAKKLAEGLPEADIEFALSFEEVLKKARLMAKPGDIVLLSPACASLDMFKNYEHRGEVYEQLVHKL
ncbi:MAG: UDP-N-acetylmuramoyl-L-alanine--D-glutamate ligase [Gammaproteobacteria bacterium]|nr:UDP-N-acetylmuramoyl-L-alanine--D-glutamate ligase [Gammaproteobacteria bacterium]